MKKNSLQILLLLLLPFSITGQLIDSIYPEMNDRQREPWNSVTNMHHLGGDTFLIVMEYGQVLKLKLDGELIWERRIPNSQFNGIVTTSSELVAGDHPDKLIIFARNDECDTWSSYFRYVFDISNRYFENRIYFGTGRFLFPEFPGLPKYLLISDSSYILRYFPDSIVEVKGYTGLRAFDINGRGDFTVMSKDSIFLFRNEQGAFSEISKRGFPTDAWLTSMRFSSDSTLILFGDSIVVLLDKELNPIRQFEFDYVVNKTRFKWAHPNLIITINSLESDEMIILDPFLVPVFAEDPPFPGRIMEHSRLIMDSLLVSAGWIYNYENGHSFVKAYDYRQNAINVETDIALTNLNFDNVTTIGPHSCSMQNLISYKIENASIELTNRGNVSIDSVTIVAERSTCFHYCSPEPLYKTQLKNIDLQSGESKTFYLGEIQIEDRDPDYNDGLCIYAILPNNRFDIDGTNDFYCVTNTTSTPKIHPQSFSFYPNPAQDVIHFSMSDVENISISDVRGIRILNIVPNDFDQSFDISNLSPGMYFISASDIRGYCYTNRFIKQ